MNLKLEVAKACIFMLIGAFLCKHFSSKPETKEVVKTEFVEVYVKDKSETSKTHVKKYDSKGTLKKEVISENVKKDVERDKKTEEISKSVKLVVFGGAGLDFKYQNYRFSEFNPKASLGVQYDKYDLDINSDFKSNHGIYLKVKLLEL